MQPRSREAEAIFTTRPLQPGAEWGPVVLADTVGGLTIGAISGVGAAAVAEPLLYPDEHLALSQTGSQLQTARNELTQEQQTLHAAESGLGARDPQLLEQLRSHVALQGQTVTNLEKQMDALPNHGPQANELGLGLGVAAGLLVCGVKLYIQKIRTDRARR